MEKVDKRRNVIDYSYKKKHDEHTLIKRYKKKKTYYYCGKLGHIDKAC